MTITLLVTAAVLAAIGIGASIVRLVREGWAVMCRLSPGEWC